MNLATSVMDAFVAKNVKHTDWSVSADLYDTKWFGYRFITPGTSLFLFVDRYRHSYNNVPGRTKGWGDTRFSRPDLLKNCPPRYVTGFWNAMCICDDLGIPYDFYCQNVMNIADRAGWAKLPSPTQLYSDNMVLQIMERWEKYTTDQLITTQDNHYSLKFYEGHYWQKEYQDWVLDRISKRHNPKYALAQVLFEKPQVLPSRAARIFDTEIILNAKSIAA